MDNKSAEREQGEAWCLYGPMSGGKTAQLIRYATESMRQKRRIVVFGHALDNRFVVWNKCTATPSTNKTTTTNGHIVTHADAMGARTSLPAIMTHTLLPHLDHVRKDADDVYVDEANLFNEADFIGFVMALKEAGKRVYGAGLDFKWDLSVFAWFHVARQGVFDHFVAVTATCSSKGCPRAATCTKRTTNSTATILVGGLDMYQPVCQLHHPWRVVLKEGSQVTTELKP